MPRRSALVHVVHRGREMRGAAGALEDADREAESSHATRRVRHRGRPTDGGACGAQAFLRDRRPGGAALRRARKESSATRPAASRRGWPMVRRRRSLALFPSPIAAAIPLIPNAVLLPTMSFSALSADSRRAATDVQPRIAGWPAPVAPRGRPAG